ncbi:MAG: hypothetical protein K8S56_06165 [Candidatus Cloacimonetes bacterium]|nr:hypothetical protein [Candidatus Cloacimonadota bacterium]
MSLVINHTELAEDKARHPSATNEKRASSDEHLSTELPVNSVADVAAGKTLRVNKCIYSEFAVKTAEKNRIATAKNLNGIMLHNDSINTVGNNCSGVAENRWNWPYALWAKSGSRLKANGSTSGDIKTRALEVGTTEVAKNARPSAQLAHKNQTAVGLRNENTHTRLGVKQNPLEKTIYLLSIQVENVQALESRIPDVDAAHEMTRVVRNQILA